MELYLLRNLLIKLVIKTATESSVEASYDIAAANYDRSRYIIRLLKAPIGIQVSVKNNALESDSDWQHQLAAILTMFLALSAEDKARFINTFKRCSTLVGGCLTDIVVQRTYHSGYLPPYNEP